MSNQKLSAKAGQLQHGATGLTIPSSHGPAFRSAAVASGRPFPSMIHPVHPVPGNGSGGAQGPVLVTTIAGIHPPVAHPTREKDEQIFRLDDPATYGFAPNIITGAESTFDASNLLSSSASESAVRRALPMAITVGSGFYGNGDTDLSAATNATYIVNTDAYGDMSTYSMSGSLVQYQSGSASPIFCGSTPLPICSSGGQPVDARVAYDSSSGRWITSGLWLFGTNSVPTDVVAVSQTSNPTGGWFAYQFPSCGSDQIIVNGQGNSDQPHMGFNAQWIVVTSACNNSPCTSSTHQGCSLAVFDKAALYAGAVLMLNGNWFEFADPIENAQNRDNPVLTYGPTINNREYLTASAISNGDAEVVYSHIEGSTDAPVLYSSTDAVVTAFPASGTAALSTPNCTGCMNQYLSNGWTHSSGVWTFSNGHAYILSTMVLGDPSASNANQVDAVALSDAGAATSTRLTGGTGWGPFGSEITVPAVNNLGYNFALIGLEMTSPSFYPGVMAAQWDVDANSISFLNTVVQGGFTPSGSDESRWIDFTSAMTPIAGSSSVLIGGQVAAASSQDAYRSAYFTTIAGAPSPTPRPTISPRPRPSPTCKMPCY